MYKIPQSIKYQAENATIGGRGRFDAHLGWRRCRKIFCIGGLNVRENSWRAKDQRITFALFGAASVKYWRGLWSEYTVTWVPNIQLRYFFKATNTSHASRSIVDQPSVLNST